MSKDAILPNNDLTKCSVNIDADHSSHVRLPLITDDGSRWRHNTYGSALTAQPGESPRRPPNKRELAARRTDRPARTLVLPVPPSRMVASICRNKPHRSGDNVTEIFIPVTNPLERLLREIRRKTRVVGAFPDGQSALNLAAASYATSPAENGRAKRYLNMDLQKDQQMTAATTA